MSKDEVVKLMKSRGFNLLATSTVGSEVHLIFNTHTELSSSIACVVNLSNMEFTFNYASASSINRLVCGPCSSFENDEHFEEIRSKFQRDADILGLYR